jgi:hypothetical protein
VQADVTGLSVGDRLARLDGRFGLTIAGAGKLRMRTPAVRR